MNPLAIEIWLYVLAAYTLGNINECCSRVGKNKSTESIKIHGMARKSFLLKDSPAGAHRFRWRGRTKRKKKGKAWEGFVNDVELLGGQHEAKRFINTQRIPPM